MGSNNSSLYHAEKENLLFTVLMPFLTKGIILVVNCCTSEKHSFKQISTNSPVPRWLCCGGATLSQTQSIDQG